MRPISSEGRDVGDLRINFLGGLIHFLPPFLVNEALGTLRQSHYMSRVLKQTSGVLI